MRCVIWNTAWAVPHNERGQLLQGKIQRRKPDVICLTEAKAGLLPENGHLIESGPDYGYPLKEGRRKVLLWSSLPWEEDSIHDWRLACKAGSPALLMIRRYSGTVLAVNQSSPSHTFVV